MGNPNVERISILSMNIVANGYLLHYNFVVALLNDLFGIQARGGCSCAGPYGMRLFGLSEEVAKQINQVLINGLDSLKPGWFRINLNFFITPLEVRYICDCIEFIAEYGWKLVPDYIINKYTGRWKHKSYQINNLRRLSDIKYHTLTGKFQHPNHNHYIVNTAKIKDEQIYNYYLLQAKSIVDSKILQYTSLEEYDIPKDLRDSHF